MRYDGEFLTAVTPASNFGYEVVVSVTVSYCGQ